jgi:hypothetical protein
MVAVPVGEEVQAILDALTYIRAIQVMAMLLIGPSPAWLAWGAGHLVEVAGLMGPPAQGSRARTREPEPIRDGRKFMGPRVQKLLRNLQALNTGRVPTATSLLATGDHHSPCRSPAEWP